MNPPTTASGPLKGIRIIEMAGIGPGPFACMLLSDLGADILRIERPHPTAVRNPAAQAARPRTSVSERGRPTLQVDLKTDAGRRQVLSLVAQADALIEGFRPGVMERLGLGPEPCLQARPSLVYGRMTGWGQDGPLAQAAGHDINYIALTGALHAVGPSQGKPVPPLNLVGDFGGGALYLALGVVSALLEARNSGCGQVVDAAIVDGTLSLMAMMYGRAAAGLWSDHRGDNLLDGGTPWYDTYATSDGKYIAVGALEPQFYELLCRLVGAEFPDATARQAPAGFAQQRRQWEQLFAQRTRDEWCAVLEGTDACFAPVLTLAEAPKHPHLRARQSMVEVDGVLQPAPAPRFSRTPGAIQSPAGTPSESGAERAARWGVGFAET